MAKLEIQNLYHRFGRQTVLKDITLQTSTAVFGISGANGSGKSTLIKCLAGLLKPSAGLIRWTLQDESLDNLEALGRTGFAAPYVELYEELTPRENLRFLQDAHRSQPVLSVEDLLKQFQVLPFADKLYGELSTGQRQRVKLSTAVLHDPPVICLDEPGANLDREGKHLIEQSVKRLAGEGRMIVIASNQPDELSLCRELISLDDPGSGITGPTGADTETFSFK